MAILRRYDQRGAAVYHACAAFRQAKHDPSGTPIHARKLGRTNHNIAALKCFFLDIDAGASEPNKPPKPYRSSRDAANAVLEFCRAARLPNPLLVSSGHGIHSYWPLAEPLPAEEWRRYARGLKSLCDKHGLKADPAPTTNSSAVLRTPGTHNRKRGAEKQVVCGPLVGPYSIDSFSFQVTTHTRSSRSKGSDSVGFGPMPEYLRNRKSAPICDRSIIVHQTALAAVIASRCGQVRALRDTRGNVPEPLWSATLVVLAFCADGDAQAHAWSAGYGGYSEAETQGRLDRARRLTGATRCARFRDLNPVGCRRCVWLGKINSPIVLGWEHGTPSEERR